MKILETSAKWKVKEEKPIAVWEMEVEGRVAIKASNTINVPYEKCQEFFRDPVFMKSLQDNVVKMEVVWNKNDVRVIHGVMKMPGPVSNRELVAVNTFKVEGDKTYVGNRSLKNFPVQAEKDTERAHLHVGGFIFEKVDAGKTKVTNISDMDPKGSIPGFVKNALASKRA